MASPRFAALAVAASISLVAASCGGDDGGGSDADRSEIVDQLVAAAEEQNIDIDRDCAEDLAGELPDADVEAILAAGPDGDPELSPEAEEVTARLFSCVDVGSLADQLSSELEASGLEVDEDCVRDIVSGLSEEELANFGEGDLAGSFAQDIFNCTSGG